MKKCWTRTDIPDLSNKIAIVTGGNTGLGFQSALELAKSGCYTIITCRDEHKASSAIAELKRQCPQAQAEYMLMDLTDIPSIHLFVENVMQRFQRLDILLNNAGVVNLKQLQRTRQGYEMHFATNHLGHFALTGLLLPLIKKTPQARVVTVSSAGHKYATLNFDDIHWQTRTYDRIKAYADSKLANLLFSHSLTKEFQQHNIDAYSLAAHPGLTGTERQQTIGVGGLLAKMVASPVTVGVLPQIRACCDHELASGSYLGPRLGILGKPALIKASNAAYSNELAQQLWRLSSELTNVKYQFD
ncbi:putative short-chain dehydrogenase/reductase [Vibrio sp. MACH09]|uniref:oxidoreductase n=1 Tax=Vibrio sp. MACH09 TaxID=3025122 RepID=UPI00278D8A21|nr:oxidoreductase [Vibrio sp. MACH09]GLO62653.1 putative short-chain dehydrogenase/reductase [Vibrio sp. MACH09]